MGVVLPHGILFRGGEEGKIRTDLGRATPNCPVIALNPSSAGLSPHCGSNSL
ncbi:N-6 DNA methylase [Endozoicomonas euniceicola]|uniref:N-6 DNA methylase n=1 Tax=Endozoicomonas euniceicola TaxID=1234143 RepID=A0ABY6H1V2_9GAMM|nr:N-6 DNA methylase [Endozoicomonas euniceicola]UYM18797.1 N-6 DNA methylase [Endozoicomonas euniceicola]